MPASIVPLQTILYQLFFLLLAISVEAFVLQKQLQISPKEGVEYAASINLLSITIGWFIFFGIEKALPEPLKLQIIVYIFFDRISDLREDFLRLMLLVILIFFGTFLVKTIGFYLLQFLLTFRVTKELDEGTSQKQAETSAVISTKLSSQASAILLANASSHSVLLTIILLRWYWINFIEINGS